MLAQQLQLDLRFESLAVVEIEDVIEFCQPKAKDLTQLKYEQAHFQHLYLKFATIKTQKLLRRHLEKLNGLIQDLQITAARG